MKCDNFISKLRLAALLFCVLVVLLLSILPAGSTSDFPQGDFTLSEGRLRILNTDEPSYNDLAYKLLFSKLTIEVKEDVVDGSATTNGPTTMQEFPAQTFSGTSSIKLRGSYDKDTGTIRGKYKISDDISSKFTTGIGTILNSWWKSQGNGKFYAATISNGQVVLTFQGTRKSQGKSQRSTGNWVDASGEAKVILKIAFKVKESNHIAEETEDPEDDFEKKLEADEDYGKDSGVRFSGLNGQIQIYLPGSKTWTLAKWDQEIPVGTRIKVGNEDGDDESSAVLSFADMSTFVLRSGSEIVITGPPNKKDRASLVRGSIWANVKKIIKDGSMDIKMNQAVASIKGTTFVLEETGSSSTLKVIEGIVDFKSKKDGKIIKVNAREKIVATKDGLSEKTNFDAEKESLIWKDIESEIRKKRLPYTLIGSIAGVLIIGALAFKFIANRSSKKEKETS